MVEVGRSYKAKGIDVSLNMFVFPSTAYIDALADAVLAIGGFATYNQAGVYELGTLDEDLALGLAMRTWADLGVTEVCGWSISKISAAASAVFRKRSP